MQRLMIIVAIAASVGLAATASPGEAAVAQASATKVTVRLSEWKVVPSLRRVQSGRVTFVARNVGSVPHNLVILRTNRAPGKLPVTGNKAREVGRVARTPVFRPGQTRRLTVRLRPGKYVLICNVPGHYGLGMFVGFRVR